MDGRHGIDRGPARIQNTATFSRDQSFFFVPFVNLSEAGVKKFSRVITSPIIIMNIFINISCYRSMLSFIIHLNEYH